jgi:hypothetical protein
VTIWLLCFVISIVPALILASTIRWRRQSNRRSMLDMALWGLLIPLALYPLGCQTWLVGSMASEKVTGKDVEALQARLRKGMTPAQVAALVGRPPEDKGYFGSMDDEAPFAHHWTVRGHRLQVTFENGRATEWWSWPRREYDGFFHRFFLWWMPELD